jgi:adenylate cyclase
MVGYSRLMEADETGTLARLKTHRIELIDPAIAKNRGRIIKTTGDGMLVEFHSVVDAVLCAAEVQHRMAKRNVDVAPARWMQFRIGINLGDVIVDGNDIFGDGVNVAARLEMLADPGGICVSGAVRDQVGDRLEDIGFEDLGDQAVKNIARPIHVYRVRLEPASKAGQEDAKNTATAPGLARKPSIAVLPLVNMSGDPQQEFFADGLTEDLITELSRFHDLLVISRNSSFVYKGKAVKVQEVARELGVDYLLEGSVQKSGDSSASPQLIDAETDRHIWAERYDRELEDIFAIQDEMTRAIVATLPGRVEAASHDRANRKPTDNMAAYECVLAAKVLHHRSTREDNVQAQRLLDRALALDPNYAHAHAWKACVLGQTWVYNWCADRDATFQQVAAELEIAPRSTTMTATRTESLPPLKSIARITTGRVPSGTGARTQPKLPSCCRAAGQLLTTQATGGGHRSTGNAPQSIPSRTFEPTHAPAIAPKNMPGSRRSRGSRGPTTLITPSRSTLRRWVTRPWPPHTLSRSRGSGISAAVYPRLNTTRARSTAGAMRPALRAGLPP